MPVSGDEADDPIADESRAVLDGHIVLSSELAARAHWPAIDVLRSLSRVMEALVAPEHRAAAARVRELMATHARQRDLVLMGAYRAGSDPPTDEALLRIDEIERFLRQDPAERADYEATRMALLDLVA